MCKISYVDFMPVPKTDRTRSVCVKDLKGFSLVFKGKVPLVIPLY